MKDEVIISELLKRGKISKEDAQAFIQERRKGESALLFFIRKGLISEKEALEIFQNLSAEESKETPHEEGVVIENRYLLYNSKGSTYAIPFAHIRTAELRGNNIILYTGGVERITIPLKDVESAKQLFEQILIGIERLYLR